MLPLTRLNAFRGGLTAVICACALTLGVLPAAAAAPAARPATRISPDTAPAAVAYTYGNKPSAHSYTPEKDYSYNSTGGGIGITRSGMGCFTATFTASNDLLGDGGASGYLWANDPTASSGNPINDYYTTQWLGT